MMGYSRDSFYRFKELYDRGGELAPRKISQRRPVPKNRVEPHIEQAVVDLAIERPAYGQVPVERTHKTGRRLFRPLACGAFGCGTICTPSSGD